MNVDKNGYLIAELEDTDLVNDELRKIEFIEISCIIANELISYRKNNNISQKELAEILGVKQAMISKLESGSYNISIKSLINISKKLTDKNNSFNVNLFKKIYEKILENNNEQNYIKMKYNNIFPFNSLNNKYTYSKSYNIKSDEEKNYEYISS